MVQKNNVTIISIIVVIILMVVMSNQLTVEKESKKGAGQVSFRTINTAYSSGSAIAYTASCGDELLAFGHVGFSSSSSGGLTCDNGPGGLQGTYIMDVPGTQIGASVSIQPLKLYSDNDGSSTTGSVDFYVCSKTDTGVMMSKYLSTDPDASKVSTVPESLDINKEVICGQSSSTYTDFIGYKDNYLSGGTITEFIQLSNGWIMDDACTCTDWANTAYA